MKKWVIIFEQCAERKSGFRDVWTSHQVEMSARSLEDAVAAFHARCYINSRLVSVVREDR